MDGLQHLVKEQDELSVKRRFPSSHHREEGWPSWKEISRSDRVGEAGVEFRLKKERKTTPSALSYGCFAAFS
jgi:hypothetical protein